MGLAGPRIRRKLQHDPNNTKWSRDETTFGQKILRAQGWEPGKFLGAQNASHSHLHTAASAAPINVLLKDDTMGLGAKPRHKQNTECTGLDVFKDLLGRLNGKSEEVIEKERKVKSEVKTCLYVERKYGTMRFVSGGLLVGDQMAGLTSTTTKTETPAEDIKEEGIKEEDIKEESVTSLEDVPDRPVKKQKKEKKSKKRKAEDVDSADEPDATTEKKRKKRSKDNTSQDDSASTVEAEGSSKKKKSKKSKQKDTEGSEPHESEKKKSKKSKQDAEREVESDDTPILSEETRVEKSKSKKDKKDKKERHRKKDKKQKQSNTSNSLTDASISADTSTPASGTTPQESGASTPIGTGTSTPQPFSARHLARSRHIASKRMAIADLQAMNQIFMVKPV
ncbi:hypothetical protein F5Y00DRAFT_258461 [Daldinia vernicosa]|uniref:uncharacterized protein n=1 Tax=Daldinia vernicosa TaxID=114800 RepID=UPI0020081097|nr:uncharacterized protein F5Y00DRAFT_258461 [Daldinia vernicosa]KAI0852612.1 hypothetical protein F5Y00DRAFT_258461 [Daldinia vernicosa]